jgi:hypothetical protein
MSIGQIMWKLQASTITTSKKVELSRTESNRIESWIQIEININTLEMNQIILNSYKIKKKSNQVKLNEMNLNLTTLISLNLYSFSLNNINKLDIFNKEWNLKWNISLY